MSKFLDNTGLSHLWNKIKSYLILWKTENFGSGTIDVDTNAELRVGKWHDDFTDAGSGRYYITEPHGILVGKAGTKLSGTYNCGVVNTSGEALILAIAVASYENAKVSEYKTFISYLADNDAYYFSVNNAHPGPFLAMWCTDTLETAEQ